VTPGLSLLPGLSPLPGFVSDCAYAAAVATLSAIVPGPRRDVLLIDLLLEGEPALRPYALRAPHLGGSGLQNFAKIAAYRNYRVLWAEEGPFGLALAAVDPSQQDAWGPAGAGYAGASDGWQDFKRNGAMRWQHTQAGPGNVALTGKLPRRATLARGLGSSKESAATLAISALLQPFETPWQQQISDWRAWHDSCRQHRDPIADAPSDLQKAYVTSAMVLRVHQDKTHPGAMVASLSVPWGNTRDERGGYHLVWPRDLVECAGALLALGAEDEARDILRYLPGLAAAHRRARPLRARHRSRRLALCRCDGGDVRGRRHHAGADLGQRRTTGARSVSWPAHWFGDAAGVGARRIHQAARLTPPRPSL
jgi:Glucodextranase, domain N/Glycosyl hydrolases family 15